MDADRPLVCVGCDEGDLLEASGYEPSSDGGGDVGTAPA